MKIDLKYMKAKLIKEKLDFNREGEPLKKIRISKKEELYLSKIQDFFNNINIDLTYYKNENQWIINFFNNGLKILNSINNYTGIYENDIFLLLQDDENIFNYKISEWQDFCRGVIEEITGGGINQLIVGAQEIKENLEKIYE
ncbi:MAG: hypothetical protein PHF86_02050 [Candidatus Nanoarchaeia archaeon]|nr:hypothetical protein [Candidatus Nanoarchaeia archaeon]